MGNLEHNIKEAFTAKDLNTKLSDKEAVWNRLEGALHQKKGVVAFWRVAAIFLLFMLSAGVFAAINNRIKQKNELGKIARENTRLISLVDSLKALPVETKTEVQIVEKEKVVYRDRQNVLENTNSERIWETKYYQLADSVELILAQNTGKYELLIEKLNEELNTAQIELARANQGEEIQSKNNSSTPFELKTERIEIGVSKKPVIKNSEIQMKIFQKNFIENRNNLNRTIFKQ